MGSAGVSLAAAAAAIFGQRTAAAMGGVGGYNNKIQGWDTCQAVVGTIKLIREGCAVEEPREEGMDLLGIRSKIEKKIC